MTMIDFIRQQPHKPMIEQSIIFRLLAAPLSYLFCAVVFLRNQLFDRGLRKPQHLPGKTISVGNLIAGGTGKSPITLEIARILQQQGACPAILTRGYGIKLAKSDSLVLRAGQIVLPPENTTEWDGCLPDEARMLSMALPELFIVIGVQRYTAAMRFLSHSELSSLNGGISHWLLDDGFQHRQLARDLDIVLLDASKPFGNGCMLPLGTLREPPKSLARASAVILTRASEQKQILASVQSTYQGPILHARFSTECNSTILAPALLCTGIAYPTPLLDDLRQMGVQLSTPYIVEDHQRFDRTELQKRLGNSRCVLTTTKDYWRDPNVFIDLPVPVYLLQLNVHFVGQSLNSILSKS